MKKKLIVPKFKNDDEEFNFWSKLDLSEYYTSADFKHFDIDTLITDSQKSRTRRITMRLPDKLIEKVKQQASKLDVPYQSLMKMYIQQGSEKI
jgi:predicted DNA binding CopG/RHH family protein